MIRHSTLNRRDFASNMRIFRINERITNEIDFMNEETRKPLKTRLKKKEEEKNKPP